jgi:hypothetical protein
MIIQSCIICIGDEELSVAAKAIEAVSSVAGTPGGLAFLFGDPNVAVNRLTELMGRSETVKFRVFEVNVQTNVPYRNHSCIVLNGSSVLPYITRPPPGLGTPLGQVTVFRG